MSLEFVGRLQKELSLTGSVVYESVLAIAERVNRKVQILRLHGQASGLLSEIETVHQQLGQRLAVAVRGKTTSGRETSSDLDPAVGQALDRVHELKQTLVQVDGQIRELKMETIHEDLLKLQRDLSLRSAALERFTVMPNSPASSQSVAALAIPSSVRLVTVLRGPFLIPPSDGFHLRPGDIVIAIGLRTDLDRLALSFAAAHRTRPS